MSPVRAGQHRTRVQIEELTHTQNSIGEPIESWSILDIRWAKIMPLSGRELMEAEQYRAGVTHRVEIRAPGLALRPEMRLLVRGTSRYLHLVQVFDKGELGEVYLCTAEERYS